MLALKSHNDQIITVLRLESESVNSFWAGLFMCEIQPRVLEIIAQKTDN